MSDTAPTITAWPALLNREGLADYLSIGETTLDSMRANGQLGPREVRLGRRCVRWSRFEIDAWIAAGMPARPQWIAQKGKPRLAAG